MRIASRTSMPPEDIKTKASGSLLTPRAALIALGRLLRELDARLADDDRSATLSLLEQIATSLAASAPAPLSDEQRTARLREIGELRRKLTRRGLGEDPAR